MEISLSLEMQIKYSGKINFDVRQVCLAVEPEFVAEKYQESLLQSLPESSVVLMSLLQELLLAWQAHMSGLLKSC